MDAYSREKKAHNERMLVLKNKRKEKLVRIHNTLIKCKEEGKECTNIIGYTLTDDDKLQVAR